MMGGTDEEALKWEKPVHKVLVSTFYIGKFPVTQALWQAVMGRNPSGHKGEDRPVEQVSWQDVVNKFLPKLNELTGITYRLPSESEWEFAARGGRESAGYVYSGSDKLKQVGWFDENSGSETHPVGQKMANELGLYDMSGNVWEWCSDIWHDNYNDAPVNGTPWLSDDMSPDRVLRGGGAYGESQSCRVASRGNDRPVVGYSTLGFRLALSLQ